MNLCGCRKARKALGIDDGEDYDAFFTAAPVGRGRHSFCADEAITTTQWSYVGHGRGGYEKVETFNYVGEGQGDFHKDVHTLYRRDPRATALRNCCLIFLVLAVLAAGVYKAVSTVLGPNAPLPGAGTTTAAPLGSAPAFAAANGSWAGSAGSTSLAPTASAQEGMLPEADGGPRLGVVQRPSSTRPGYCTAGLPTSHQSGAGQDGDLPKTSRRYIPPVGEDEGPGLWSPERRRYCCEVEGVACPSTSTAETSTSSAEEAATASPSSCSMGDESMWPRAKAAYCCREEGVGCSTTPSRTTGEHAPPEGGSSSPSISTSPPFDCQAGLNNAEAGWSDAKKAWCCTQHRLGCVESPASTLAGSTTTTMLYDCQAGYNNWENDWAEAKKVWCCTQYSRGCAIAAGTGSTTAPLYSCKGGGPGPQLQWSVAQNFWCCEHFQVGCMPVVNTSSSTVAATAATTSTTASTTSTKTTGTRATTVTTTSARATTATVTSTSVTRTKEPTTTTTQTATETTSTGRTAVAAAEKSAALDAALLTSSMAPASSLAEEVEFDCVSTMTDYEWSDRKKAYCCSTQDVCVLAPEEETQTVTTSGAFDCGAESRLWQVGWSRRKKEWCCLHEGKGCEQSARQFDCAKRKEAWSEEKRAWCCEQEAVACGPYASR